MSRNCHTQHGKHYKCRDCGRQFVLDPQWQVLSEEQKGSINCCSSGSRLLELRECCNCPRTEAASIK